MSYYPQESSKFQSFNSRIRNAYKNEEIENILQDLSPENIKKRLKTLAKKRGESKNTTFSGKSVKYFIYSDSNFHIVYTPHLYEVKFFRDGFGEIFHMVAKDIKKFDSISVWRVMNLIEEIIENGEIEL